jgi:hypothetical protein
MYIDYLFSPILEDKKILTALTFSGMNLILKKKKDLNPSFDVSPFILFTDKDMLD